MPATTKKLELVERTYELLKTISPKDLTIRTVAEAAGCTSGAIYRHFDSLEHLVTVASAKFLEDYVVDFGELLDSDADTLALHRGMWDLLAKHAFPNVEVFELLFWASHEDVLTDSIYTYYQIASHKWQHKSTYLTWIFFESSLRDRAMITLKQCAAIGLIPLAETDKMADIECSLLHGMLMEYRDTYRDPDKAEEGRARFMELIDYLLSSRIKA